MIEALNNNMEKMYRYLLDFGREHPNEVYSRTWEVDKSLVTIYIAGENIYIQLWGWYYREPTKITKQYERSLYEDTYACKEMKLNMHLLWESVKNWLHEGETIADKKKRLVKEFGQC